MSEQPFSRPLSHTNSRGLGSHPPRNPGSPSEKHSQSVFLHIRSFRLVIFAALIFISGLWLIAHFGGHPGVSFGIKDADSAAAAAAVQLDGEMPAPPVFLQQQEVGLESEIRAIIANHKVVVFSKTYCPYSRRAKLTLDKYNIKPKYFVVEVDLRADAAEVKEALGILTSRYTFPNVFVNGKTIGGSDEISGMDERGLLREALAQAGVL